jgi:hypothetical protein
VQTRRLVAVGVIVVIVIVIALLVHSCDASATNDSLKSFNANVYRLVERSTANAQGVLRDLSSGKLTTITQDLASREQRARADVSTAQNLHTPSQMAGAQSSLVSVMQFRQRALLLIAQNAQQAASRSTSKGAIYEISLGTSQLYASDVLYKSVVAPDIAKALNAAGIPIGGGSGEQQINAEQVVPDLGWLNQTWIADRIGAQLSTAQANADNNQPGNHGHRLNYVTVGGVPIYTTSTNTLARAQSQTWTLNVTNDGLFPEYDVGCTVRIEGASDVGTSTLAVTTPNETTNCIVHLPSEPPAGTYSVFVSIAGVPRENDLQNNRGTYPVTFH